MKKRIYITGCLGFIGSYITRQALQRGWHVYGVDKKTYVSNLHPSNNLKMFNMCQNFTFLEKDIQDIKFLYDCDYVINVAAESHVSNSIQNADDFLDTNVLGVKHLLDLIRDKSEVDRPLFFHFSTDEVYGDIEEGSFKEGDPLSPSNPYAASKAAADMLIKAWSRTYDLNYVIFRPTNNYGIGQYPEKLIPLCVRNLNHGKKIRLHNDGEPFRNWLHVEDTCDAVFCILDSGETGIFNCEGGFELKNYQTVSSVIAAYHGVDLAELDIDMMADYLDFSYDRPGQDVRYALDDSRLRNLGWRPKKDFKKEVHKIVNFYKENFIW